MGELEVAHDERHLRDICSIFRLGTYGIGRSGNTIGIYRGTPSSVILRRRLTTIPLILPVCTVITKYIVIITT